MKKQGVLLIFFLVLAITFSPHLSAQAATPAEKVSDAYECLESEIDARTEAAISLEEASFSILALGSKSKLSSKLDSEKSTSASCWPKSSCTLKATAQALLANDRLGKSTTSIENYLISKNATATGLSWSLLIDIESHNSSSCTVKHGSTTNSISIGEDMKLSSENLGNCLFIEPSGYWLQISPSSSCTNQKYQISCDKSFVTTLLYQKESEPETVYVSSQTHSAASSGTTTEEVNARCFSQSGECDYEGSLWATLALQKTGQDVSAFVPYLIALAPENSEYLPSSFIYSITRGTDHYSSLVQAQKTEKYWQAANTPYNKFYDTALALLALQGSSSLEADAARSYLLNIQTPNGCWNNDNIRDTAFLIYAGWSEQTLTRANEPELDTLCSEAGYFCESLIQCNEAGGTVYGDFICPGFSKCCSVDVRQQSCSQQSGRLCSTNEICSGTQVSSSDGSCCLGTCSQSATSECETAGGFCSNSCASNEEEASYSCTISSDVCCVQKQESGSNWTVWIILIILIILVLVAIIFRKKLQLALFKFRKGGVSSAPIIQRPRFPPVSPYPMQRPMPSRPQAPRRPASQSDKDMEETLKKLREMGK